MQIFHSGDEYFQSLTKSIQSASQSITIESYIFNVDKMTLTILNELKSAVDRGCSVKIIVDGFGSYLQIPQLAILCAERGIELRVFHPFPYPLFWARSKVHHFSSGVSFLIAHFNRRNHRKISIIDEKEAYLGSFNFTQEHCSQYVGSNAWRDTGVAVEGSVIQHLVRAFQLSYMRTFVKNFMGFSGRQKHIKDPHHDVLRLNTTNRSRRQLYKNLLHRLSNAKSRIYISTAYFLPKRSLLKAILKASRRGVDVKILIPGKSDTVVVKWAAFYILRLLLKRRIPIFEYQKSILHAKTMILDDQVFVGSFNLNHRSILHDLEVEVVLSDAHSLNNMLNQWMVDLSFSKPVVENDYKAASLLARVIYSIAFKLRYLF